MTDAELLELLQDTAIVVDLDIATAGERDKSIPSGARADLAAVMGEIRNAFELNSIEFGYRRLILASMFKDVVMKAGAARQKLPALLANLTEEQREGFSTKFYYEPVPRGDGFRVLPPEFAGALSKTCDKRQVDNYYAGMDNLLALTRSACIAYVDRIAEYDKAENTSKKTVIRVVLVTRLQERLKLLQVYNIMRSDRYNAITELAHAVHTHNIDALRKDANARASVLSASTRILELLNGLVLGSDEEGADDDAQPEA